MSYCRWSTDDFQCDLYVYESCYGGFDTHVAALKPVYKEPLPPPIELTSETVEQWHERHQHIMEMHRRADKVPIGLPHDGERFNDETAEDCLYRLIDLRRVGYRFPVEVLEALRDEVWGKTEQGPRWYVHVCVCGNYAGSYKFATFDEAEADYQDRKKFHVIGARYELTGSPQQPEHFGIV